MFFPLLKFSCLLLFLVMATIFLDLLQYLFTLSSILLLSSFFLIYKFFFFCLFSNCRIHLLQQLLNSHPLLHPCPKNEGSTCPLLQIPLHLVSDPGAPRLVPSQCQQLVLLNNVQHHHRMSVIIMGIPGGKFTNTFCHSNKPNETHVSIWVFYLILFIFF